MSIDRASYARTMVLPMVAIILLVGGITLATSRVSNAAVCRGLVQQAEDGTLRGRMVAVSAGDRTFVELPDGAGPGQPTDFVEFCVNIPASGTFKMEAMTHAPTRADDSFFVSFDGRSPTIWAPGSRVPGAGTL